MLGKTRTISGRLEKRRLEKKCYLCGQDGAVTDEHIPPKCLSPKSSRKSFLFVPACIQCNGKFSAEESKLRDFLVVSSAGYGNKSADEAYESMRRGFQRNPLGTFLTGNPNKDLLRLIKNISRVNLVSPHGIFLEKRHTISPPPDLNYEAVLIKIVKGLLYFHKKEIVPPDYVGGAVLIDEIPYPELFEKCGMIGTCGDFFSYKGGVTRTDRKSGIWYMVFYRKIFAIAWLLPPTVGKSRTETTP